MKQLWLVKPGRCILKEVHLNKPVFVGAGLLDYWYKAEIIGKTRPYEIANYPMRINPTYRAC